MRSSDGNTGGEMKGLGKGRTHLVQGAQLGPFRASSEASDRSYAFPEPSESSADSIADALLPVGIVIESEFLAPPASSSSSSEVALRCRKLGMRVRRGWLRI